MYISVSGTFKPDVTLAIPEETSAKLYVSQATPEDLIQNGEIKVNGHSDEAARLINLFDRYLPEKAVVVPPFAFSAKR